MRAGSGMSVGLWTVQLAAVGERELELDRRHRRHQVDVVLALQALAHDVHVQQAEEAAAEAEAERVGVLGLPEQRGVVERQLLERVAQLLELVGLDREQAAEHHRLDLAVAGQRLAGRVRARGQRVADGQAPDVLDAGDQVADLAGGELVGGRHRGREEADVVDVGLRAGHHRADRLALREGAVDHADVGDHAAVLVVLGVEDQRARRRVGVAVRAAGRARRAPRAPRRRPRRSWRRCAGPRRVLADQVGDLLRHALGLGAGQVDLVQARDQLEPGVDGQVGVRDGLGLDALGRVDDQQRALAGGERARDLVGEVDVAGRVDQLQLVGLAVLRGEEDAHRLGLDRDPALALEVHRVQQLRAHRARVDGVGRLEDAVGQRRLPMVDMGDDREVPDVGLVRHGARRGYDAVLPSLRWMIPAIWRASGMRSAIHRGDVDDARHRERDRDAHELGDQRLAEGRVERLPAEVGDDAEHRRRDQHQRDAAQRPADLEAVQLEPQALGLPERHRGARHRGADDDAGDPERLVERELTRRR